MLTECIPDLFGFAPVEGRAVVAAFDGGSMTSDAGAMLLGATDRVIDLVGRFGGCFEDHRAAELIEHEVRTLVGQRVYGIALGYEDLIDHDELRHDPVMAVLAGKLAARRSDCAPLAGKSTLNRLELSRPEPTRYHKISYDGAAIERLFVDLFLEAHGQTPQQIILDLDATDDPLHGDQEGRFFHGYGACPRAGEAGPGGLLLLPAALRLLRQALVGGQAAPGRHRRQRRSDRGGGAHRRPDPRALAHRAHLASGRFGLRARGVDGVVRKQRGRLSVRSRPQRPPRRRDRGRTRSCCRAGPEERHAGAALQEPAPAQAGDFTWTTRDSWSRERRVVAKAEWLPGASPASGEANPRFVVTSLTREEHEGRHLYEKLYCARGDMENRIKECQLDLFADRTSAKTMRANQLRLWFAAMAYVLLCALRRLALTHTPFARASCGTIRLKLLKIGALVRTSVRRIKLAMPSAFAYQAEYRTAHAALTANSR